MSLAVMHEMIGLSLREQLEMQQQNAYLRSQKRYFFGELALWLKRYGFPTLDPVSLFIDDFYEVLISGEYTDCFYTTNYHQAIHWQTLGLTQSEVMLLLSQCRVLFIRVTAKPENTTLARALCNAIDVCQLVVTSVYQMHTSMQYMKRKLTDEVARMRRSFRVVSAAVPEVLIQAFVDHQNWKVRAYSLALGEIEEGNFPYSSSQCLLGKWLNSGGQEKIPEEGRIAFNEAHEQVHRLGHLALTDALAHHPERIVEFLVEMEVASDEVSRVLLDLIEAEFIRLATFDTLTNLPTRRAFDEKLEQNLAFSHRYDFWVELILIDVDHFKLINDKHGHNFGDKVLKEIAGVLSDAVRHEDSVYRWGGEEFAVLSLDKEPDGKHLAERLRQRVEQHVFSFAEAFAGFKITVSCGAVSLSPEARVPKETLFALADEQLYKSKRGGRNQVNYRTLEAE